MKNKTLSTLLLLLASPIALFASSETDRKIEEAAKASYNYRTVLENHVKVTARDGIVTLTGAVQDKDDKALAEDTVENLPGVTSVKNEIKIKLDINPKVPLALSNLIMESVATNPKKRPAEMDQVISRMELVKHIVMKQQAAAEAGASGRSR